MQYCYRNTHPINNNLQLFSKYVIFKQDHQLLIIIMFFSLQFAASSSICIPKLINVKYLTCYFLNLILMFFLFLLFMIEDVVSVKKPDKEPERRHHYHHMLILGGSDCKKIVHMIDNCYNLHHNHCNLSQALKHYL